MTRIIQGETDLEHGEATVTVTIEVTGKTGKAEEAIAAPIENAVRGGSEHVVWENPAKSE